MPNFNLRSITSLQMGVQSRTITLTGNKRNPASFCACYTFTRHRSCSPEPFYKGESYLRTTLRVAVLKADKNGYRRPVYKHLKWRINCFTTLISSLLELHYTKWVVDEATKLRERQERAIERRKIIEVNRKSNGRPRLNITEEQRRVRRGLQRKLSVYKKRAQQAFDRNDFDLFKSRTETVERFKKMIEAQTTTEPFKHDPLFDPNKLEVNNDDQD